MTNVKHTREHAKHSKPKKARFVKLAKKNPPPCKKTTIAIFVIPACFRHFRASGNLPNYRRQRRRGIKTL